MNYIKTFEGFFDFFKKKPLEVSYETEVSLICKSYGIKNWSINSDGLVDVEGDVDLTTPPFKSLKSIPIKFGKVTGSFYCQSNNLTSLEGCPHTVGRDFNCHGNKLTSLEGSPKSVGGSFNCFQNKLTNLEGAPEKTGGSFYCQENELTSLKGCPHTIGGGFNCKDNKLTSLEYYPKSVGGDFNCVNNNIHSMEFIPRTRNIRGSFYKYNNPISEIFELIYIKGTFKYKYETIELLNDYDCIRGVDIIIDRFNDFLQEIGKDPVEKVNGYNNI